MIVVDGVPSPHENTALQDWPVLASTKVESPLAMDAGKADAETEILPECPGAIRIDATTTSSIALIVFELFTSFTVKEVGEAHRADYGNEKNSAEAY